MDIINGYIWCKLSQDEFKFIVMHTINDKMVFDSNFDYFKASEFNYSITLDNFIKNIIHIIDFDYEDFSVDIYAKDNSFKNIDIESICTEELQKAIKKTLNTLFIENPLEVYTIDELEEYEIKNFDEFADKMKKDDYIELNRSNDAILFYRADHTYIIDNAINYSTY